MDLEMRGNELVTGTDSAGDMGEPLTIQILSLVFPSFLAP